MHRSNRRGRAAITTVHRRIYTVCSAAGIRNWPTMSMIADGKAMLQLGSTTGWNGSAKVCSVGLCGIHGLSGLHSRLIGEVACVSLCEEWDESIHTSFFTRSVLVTA
jgi:hypothetical protein